MQNTGSEVRQLKVFLSYSRKDGAFAEELLAALEACGFAAYLDKHDIAPGEAWEERLARLITEADTVVFIVSPDSVASERCTWEVEKTEALGKRLLPVVCRPTEEHSIPARLRRLNFTFFDDGHRFGIGLRELAGALNTDIGWIREHTRLGELASRWEQRGHAETLLLRAQELQDAKQWIVDQPRDAAAPSELHKTFIAASEQFEEQTIARVAAQEAALRSAELAQERLAREKAESTAQAAKQLAEAARRTARRTLAGLAATLLLVCIAAYLGWNYLEERQTAERQRLALGAQQAAAETERAIGAESLGETSRVLLESGDTTRALQAAYEALRLSKAMAAKNPKNALQERDVAISLLRLGDVLRAAGRKSEAFEAYNSALIMQERVLSIQHPDIAQSLYRIAALHTLAGRYADAEPLQRRALSIRESAIGSDHPFVARNLEALAELHSRLAQFDRSEQLHKRALEIREKALGYDDPEVARSLGNLGTLYGDKGRISEAEELVRRALSIFDSAWGPEHPDVAAGLNQLAEIYVKSGRFSQAEPLFERSLKIREKALGGEHPDQGSSLSNLATLYRKTNRYAEAEALYKRSLSIYETSFGAQHPAVADTLHHLGVLIETVAAERHVEAEALFRKALVIRERLLGPDHPSVAEDLEALGRLSFQHDQYEEAGTLLASALAIREKALGPEHPDVARNLRELGRMNARRASWERAITYYRQAAAIVGGQLRRQSEIEGSANIQSIWSEYRNVFLGLVSSGWHLSIADPSSRDFLLKESFGAVQMATRTEAGSAVDLSAARLSASGTPFLWTLLRERQDLSTEQRAAGRRLIAAVAGISKQDKQALGARSETIRRRLTEIDGQLAKEFPEYSRLLGERPTSLDEAQALLSPQEALVLISFSDVEGFIWIATKTTVRWSRIPKSEKEVSDIVGTLLCGLSDQRWSGAENAANCAAQLGLSEIPSSSDPLPFNLQISYGLYGDLFNFAEDLIKGKELLIVPPSALSNLPFSVLVSRKPEESIPKTFAGYRAASWFGATNAITVLPSVGSLKVLRTYGKRSRAPEAYIGFGDPTLSGDGTCRATPDPGRCPAGPESAADSPRSTEVERPVPAPPKSTTGIGVDQSKLRALCPLPETTFELRCTSRILGASSANLRMGPAATESEIKRLSSTGELARYRVIHFATHALSSYDSAKLGLPEPEPGLVLSPPTIPTQEDDGLLTLSEIMQLKMDAEWVVLSTGAETELLSGLAPAFIYAGARGLLLAYLPPYSDVAVRLMTQTFAQGERDPAASRAETLRRAMVGLLEDPSQNDNAHPSIWSAFGVFGQ